MARLLVRPLGQVLVLLALLASPGQLLAARLIAVLAADTFDPKIGKSTAQDLEYMKQQMRIMARASRMDLELHTLSGYQFTRSRVQRTLASLRPGPDDAVVFYSSSHGFRTPSKTTTWPYVALQGGKGMDQYAIFKTLYQKKPRLLLCLSDCCNNYLADGTVDVGGIRSRTMRRSPNGYYTLFRKGRAAILCSSSRPGEYAMGTNKGGLFTSRFLYALYNASANTNANWGTVMMNAGQPIYLGLAEQSYQRPQYRIYRSPSSTYVPPTGTTTTTPSPSESGAGHASATGTNPASSTSSPFIPGFSGGWGGVTITVNGTSFTFPNPGNPFLSRSKETKADARTIFVTLAGVNCNYTLASGGQYPLGGCLGCAGINTKQTIRVPKDYRVLVLLNGKNNKLRVPTSLRGKVTTKVVGVGNLVR